MISPQTEIYVYTQPVDMRKQMDGLVNLLVDRFGQNPQHGGLFVFTDKSRRKLKILFWDRNGFVLYYKRLEKHRFHYDKSLTEPTVTINEKQMKALLMGLDFHLLSQYPVEQYSDFF